MKKQTSPATNMRDFYCPRTIVRLISHIVSPKKYGGNKNPHKHFAPVRSRDILHCVPSFTRPGANLFPCSQLLLNHYSKDVSSTNRYYSYLIGMGLIAQTDCTVQTFTGINRDELGSCSSQAYISGDAEALLA